MSGIVQFITRALSEAPESVADEVAAWRTQFRDIHFTTDKPTI